MQGRRHGCAGEIDACLMNELIKYIAAALVDNQDAVEVSAAEKDDVTIYELRVAKEDLGKVIGKQGRTARAIRSVLTAAASRNDKKARLEIVE